MDCVFGWVGGYDWSSGDWIIYRIFAQWLAGGQTTGALGPVGLDLLSGRSGSLTVTPCDSKNDIAETNRNTKEEKKDLSMHACVHKG